MKRSHKEIVLTLVITVITLLTVWYFFDKVQDERKMSEVDLYGLIAPEANAVLTINRPRTFSSMILSHKETYSLFNSYLPEVFLSLVQNSKPYTSFLITFYDGEVILTGKTDSRQIRHWEKEVFKPLLSSYPANRKKDEYVSFSFYPDTLNRFLGYYFHEGFFAASYSKRLLDNMVQLQSGQSLSSEVRLSLEAMDKSAPINMAFPANQMNLHASINDSTRWSIRDQWLTIDIFTNEGKMCCHSNIPAISVPDTLRTAMADTLTLRLKEFFPTLQIDPEVSSDENNLYYTGCSEFR